ncbi:hypothetical protein F5Y05DRAFT_414649 [Hypoxylon sp. FL0543]|nr:hypothetical protein F5Y05DRAFT_414649 [Hypoxylon sp. FL0543]
MEKEPEAIVGINRPRFSLSTKILLWVVLPLILIARAIPSPLSAALTPVILIPTFCLLRYDRARPADQRVDLETFIWTFMLTGWVGAWVVALAQVALSWLFIFMVFQDTTYVIIHEVLWGTTSMKTFATAMTAYMKRKRVLWAFMALSHHFVTAFSEASLNYLGLMYARRRGRITHEHNYVTLGAAAALGYITLQSHFFLFSTTQGDYKLIDLANNLVDYGWGMSIMSGVLTGLDTARRDFRGEKLSLLRILYLPALFQCIWVLSMTFAANLIYYFGEYMGSFPLGGRSVVQLCVISIISILVQGSLAVVVRERFAKWKAQQKKAA